MESKISLNLYLDEEKKIPFPGAKSDLRAWNHISLKLIKSNEKKTSALTMITFKEREHDN